MATFTSFQIPGFQNSLCSSIPKTHIRTKPPISSLPCSQFIKPNLGPICKLSTLSRSGISCRRREAVDRWFRVPKISCLLEDSCPETKDGTIDLKLPRRSLLLSFTCDACGARSERLINRLAYERGLVYVQCSGCSKYHKLVDNLGLVAEYNLQEEEIDLITDADQV